MLSKEGYLYFINQLSWDDSGFSVRRYRLVKFVNKSLLESSKKNGGLFFHEMFHCPPTTMAQVSWRNFFYRCDVGGKSFNNILK